MELTNPQTSETTASEEDDSAQILPCPFCGHEAEINSTRDYDNPVWVGCSNERCWTFGHGTPDLNGWNTRVLSAR